MTKRKTKSPPSENRMKVDTETTAGMRKIGAIVGITVLALAFPLPAAAFGIHLGPLYFHVPFVGHHHRHRLQMRAKEEPNNVSRVQRDG